MMLEACVLAVLALGGIGAAAFSLALGLTDGTNPGSGLLPFAAGAVLASCSVVRLFALRSGTGRGVLSPLWPEHLSRRRVGLVMATLIAMTLALPLVGFVPSSFAALAILFRYYDHGSWPKSLFMAAAFALAAYLLFGLWLGVPLPRGMPGV